MTNDINSPAITGEGLEDPYRQTTPKQPTPTGFGFININRLTPLAGGSTPRTLVMTLFFVGGLGVDEVKVVLSNDAFPVGQGSGSQFYGLDH
ncbi:hypothetical protein JTE90_001009 [Oedothorax gibbosus]|uniref:Uncharacterized protein n=1 Tax=Oedothorax gibbosus TaxID=931172 RepID=A0AAV6TWA8_9ARAC|nr:hypothetical protein JTE90_001009 [Oedothorax gibbosus]